MKSYLSTLKEKPYVTYILILINTLVLLYMGWLDIVGQSSDLVIDQGGVFRYFVITFNQWYRLLTAGFIHLSLEHFLFNMLAVYFVGIELEYLLGHGPYLFVYLMSLLGGSVFSLALSDPYTLSVGASTAVFGLFAAYIMLSQLYPQSAYLGARARNYALLIGLNLVMNLFSTDIDMWGHIGGAIGGILSTGVVGIAGVSLKSRWKQGLTWFVVLMFYGMICVFIALNRSQY